MIALLIDIGNTRIKWRIARIDAGNLHPDWLTVEHALATNDPRAIADAFIGQSELAVDAVWCSNVARDDIEVLVREAVARIWRDAPFRALRPVSNQCGVINGYREPTTLGPDRWLAMIGAHARFPGRTLLVCSFGTATTIDLLVATGPDTACFVGGLILPGFDAMRAALRTGTARLPLADGQTVDFADNTDDAITSGVVAAQVGAVEHAWRQAVTTAGTASITCVLAGGGADAMASQLADLDRDTEMAHDLVLLGLAAVACDSLNASAGTTDIPTCARSS